MTTNYFELRQHLEDRLTQFDCELPGPMTGFARLPKKGWKTALAISIAVSFEDRIADHVHDAIKAGATRPELLEAISGQQLGVRRV